MSHVDEGALHAYLDGALEEYPTGEARRIRAHLERCERCAEALTEARLVRDRAEAVLATPALNVTPPPLEELKRIASSGGAEARESRAWGRRQRLGWAASVVLALGIGWIVRGGMPLPTAGPDRTASTAESPRDRDADSGDADKIGAVAEAPSTDAGALPVADQVPETAVEASEESAAAVVDDVLDRSVPSEERAVMAEARPAAVSPPEGTEPEPAAPSTLQDIDATSVESDQAGRLGAELDIPIDVVSPNLVPTAPGLAAGLPAESIEAGTAGVEREGTPRSEAARLSLASRSAAAGPALARAIERARSGDEAQVDEASEPGSLVVPGLEVLSIVWREEGVVPAGVRVIQRLGEDQELELIHLPAGFDPAAVDPAEAGVNELVVPRDQGWLILRAPVGEEELRLFLDRMDAPDPDR